MGDGILFYRGQPKPLDFGQRVTNLSNRQVKSDEMSFMCFASF